MITYEIYNYDNHEINDKIITLYLKVFNYHFPDFNWWYLKNPSGRSIASIAKEDREIVGHFAVTPLPFSLKGNREINLISLGAMIDPAYQGRGIFKVLAENLLDYLENKTQYDFVIGFPNENSLSVHLGGMGYIKISEFRFAEFDNINLDYKKNYKTVNTITSSFKRGKYSYEIFRDKSYLDWRFCLQKYTCHLNTDDKWFIVTRYKNKIDLLSWDNSATDEELYDFIAYLYSTQEIEIVSAWNSINLDTIKSINERRYNFCLRFLHQRNDDILKAENWRFLAGDAELF